MSLIDTQHGGNREAAQRRYDELQTLDCNGTLDNLHDTDFNKWNRLYSEYVLLGRQLEGEPDWMDITLEFVMGVQ